MANLDINQTTTPTELTDYSVEYRSPDGPNQYGETRQTFPSFPKWFGHYKSIPKLKKSIDAYATWIIGKGYDCDAGTRVTLDHISGWGEDTFQSVLWNMIVTKKVNGDSFAEVVRSPDTNRILNIKPLDPEFMTVVVNKKGVIEKYEYGINPGTEPTIFQPHEILHLCNDRVANETHGVSIIEAVQWNIEAQEEAKRAYRKMVYRNGVVRVIEIDTEDPTKISNFKTQWKTAVENGDVLLLPKGVAEAKDWHGQLDTNGMIVWLNYLDNEFYMITGIPRVILGGEPGIEAGAKMSYLSYEQIYKREVTELQADLWNQLGLKVTFIEPASIASGVAQSESKNQGQVNPQPNDTTAGVGE